MSKHLEQNEVFAVLCNLIRLKGQVFKPFIEAYMI